MSVGEYRITKLSAVGSSCGMADGNYRFDTASYSLFDRGSGRTLTEPGLGRLISRDAATGKVTEAIVTDAHPTFDGPAASGFMTVSHLPGVPEILPNMFFITLRSGSPSRYGFCLTAHRREKRLSPSRSGTTERNSHTTRRALREKPSTPGLRAATPITARSQAARWFPERTAGSRLICARAVRYSSEGFT